MKSNFVVVAALLVLSSGCREKTAPDNIPETGGALQLEGTYVSVALSRAGLGLSRESPVSRRLDASGGTTLSVSGYVLQETDRFLVIGKHRELVQNEGVEWVPLTSILTVTQPVKQDGRWNEARSGGEGTWQFERMQGVLNMVGFDLSKLPAGQLDVWITRDGKRGFLAGTQTGPGLEQWLYAGVDPASSKVLFGTVVSKESAGGGVAFFHGDRSFNSLRKVIDESHDWTKASVVAEEAGGNGKIHAVLNKK